MYLSKRKTMGWKGWNQWTDPTDGRRLFPGKGSVPNFLWSRKVDPERLACLCLKKKKFYEASLADQSKGPPEQMWRWAFYTLPSLRSSSRVKSGLVTLDLRLCSSHTILVLPTDVCGMWRGENPNLLIWQLSLSDTWKILLCLYALECTIIVYIFLPTIPSI